MSLQYGRGTSIAPRHGSMKRSPTMKRGIPQWIGSEDRTTGVDAISASNQMMAKTETAPPQPRTIWMPRRIWLV